MANPSENYVTKGGSRLGNLLSNFFRNFLIPVKHLPFSRYEEPSNDKDTRSVMLVAATLVAAVTFQSAVDPPGGVWDNDHFDKKTGHKLHSAGQAKYSSQPVPFYFFLSCNTLAFSSSIYLLLHLTFGYPFFLEVLVATLSMCGTYAAAIFAVTPSEDAHFRLIALVAALPLILRPALFLLYCMFRKVKWLPENETTNKV